MVQTTQPPLPLFVMTEEQQSDSSRIAFTWLLHLRWGAVVAQGLMALLVFLSMHIALPYGIILAILVFEIASNLCFSLVQRHKSFLNTWIFALVLFLDASLLTLLLYYSGGPMNPFTFVYLVHITMGAILLSPGWSWGFAFFTVASYASLFLLPATGSASQCHSEPFFASLNHTPGMGHLLGMWVAFTVTAFFIVFFVNRVQAALARHQKALSELQAERNRSEKLASLATLAAGAAHEFATPLSTIAVAASEMLHELQQLPQGSPDLIDDTILIREQVKHCKDILFQMSADAGEHLGEETCDFELDELLTEQLFAIPAPDQKRLEFTTATNGLIVTMPRRTLGRIVRSLIKNALDASQPDTPILISSSTDERMLRIAVQDFGTGMDPEVVARATEPFFTTKPPGKGMGLGLFLARSAAERFGGALAIDTEVGRGTTVTLTFSLRQITARLTESSVQPANK